MLAYKQALEILEFNKKPVEAAFVTTRLGTLFEEVRRCLFIFK